MGANNVIIPILFEPDDSKVTAAIDELQKKGTVSDGAAAAYKQGNSELQKRIQLDTQVDAAQKKQIATIGQLQQKTSQMATSVIQSTNAVLTNIQKQKNTVDALQKSLDKLVAGNKSPAAIANVTAALERQTAVLKEMEAEESKAEASGESLRKQKRKLTEEIARLIEAGQQETEMYQQLIAKAGAIDDAIKDASGAISRAGSDTRGLDNVVQLAGTVAAGFSIAQGAAALFGDENEDVQKTLLKVTAAMSILTGLQQIQGVLTDESIKSLLAETRLRIVKNAQLVIENGLQSTSIVVRGAATAAQWALNAAMSANPIGIVVVALAALIGGIAIYTSGVTKAAHAQASLNAAVESATTGLQAEYQAYENLSKQQQAALNATNARQSTILNNELTIDRARAEATAREIGRLRTVLAANKKNTDERKAAVAKLIELETAFDAQNADGKAKAVARDKALLEESQGDRVAAAEAAIKLARNGSAQEIAASRNAAKVRRDVALENLDKQTADEKVKANERLSINAEYNDSIEQLDIQASDKSKAARLRRLAAEKAAIDNLLILAREGSDQQLKIQLDGIDKQVQADLAGIDRRNAAAATVALEEQNILKKAEDEKRKLRITFADREIKEQAGVELLIAQARVAAFREGSKDYYDAQRVVLSQQADNNALDVQQSTDSEETKSAKIKLIYVTLNKDLDALRRTQHEAQVAQLQAEVDALNNLALTRLNIKASDPRNTDPYLAQQAVRMQELKTIEEERQRLHQKALDDSLYAEQQYQADLTNNAAKGEEKRAEIVQAAAAREKEIRESLKAAVMQIANEVSAALFDIDKAERDQELQAQLDRLSKEKDAALRAKNITEAQKANIQRVYDNRERQIKNEAARKERKASIDQAIVNGALAVTNALATVHPFYAALIAAGLAAASTAVQVAKISSTPIPQYAKGTRNAKKGYAWVGEEGPELVKLNGGEKIWTKNQSSRVERAWTSSGTHADPDDILSGRNLPSNQTAAINEYFAHGGSSSSIDYDRLGRAVAKHMPEQPNVLMNADENGLSLFMIEKNRRVQILNKRYSTKS